MAEISEQSVLGALENAFGDAPQPKAPAAPQQPAKAVPAPSEHVLERDGSEVEPMELEDLPEGEADPVEGKDAAAVPAEPEFVIEVDGQEMLVKGKDQVKELLQKGAHYSKGTEEIARVREQLAAQAQMQQHAQQFHQAVIGEIASLQALDQQLAAYDQINWSQAIDTNFVEAMKLQEQRNQLRQQRQQKVNELESKQQQFTQGQANAARQMLATQEAALLAKLPQWRNSEIATAEKQAIVQSLGDYGFQAGEIGSIMDHRMLLVARDAMKYRALQRAHSEKSKQVRDAPPVVKPGSVGTQAKAGSQAAFKDFRKTFQNQGRKGQHRAQEALLEKVLTRTFK